MTFSYNLESLSLTSLEGFQAYAFQMFDSKYNLCVLSKGLASGTHED